MSFHLAPLLAFAAAAGLLTVAPGLDTALILRTAAVEGPRPARLAAAGICTGCLAWGSATALGLTALLAVSRIAFLLVRMAGAVYLIILGLQIWLQRHKKLPPTNGNVDAAQIGQHKSDRWFFRGLLTNLLNPKVGVFYLTLLPQFVPRGGNACWYSLAFTLIHVTEGMLWLTLLTAAIRPMSNWLGRPGVKLGLDRSTGGVLIGSGLAIAFEKRR